MAKQQIGFSSRFWPWGKILLLLFIWGQPGMAVEITAIHSPLQGYFRPGFFYPIALDVRTTGEAFQGEVIFSVDTIGHKISIKMPAHSKERVWLPLILQKKFHTFHLKTRSQAGRETNWSHLLPSFSRRLRPPLEGWHTLGAVYGGSLSSSFYQLTLHILPPAGQLLESLDFIRVTALPSRQARAMLLAWTAQGGILVLSRPQWKRSFGVKSSGGIASYGLGKILAEKLTEDLAQRIPWVQGRLHPQEDRKLVALAEESPPPTLYKNLYLAFFVVYFSLVIFYFILWPTSFSPGKFWIFIGGVIIFSLVSRALPRKRIQIGELTILRGVSGRREVVGERVVFLRVLGASKTFSFQTNLPFLKPLYFSLSERENKKFTLGISRVDHLLLEKGNSAVFASSFHSLLPGPLRVQFLSPKKIRLLNGTKISFSALFFLQGDRGFFYGSPSASGVIPLAHLSSPLNTQRLPPLFQKFLPYLKERFLDPEKIYLLALGGHLPFKIQGKELAPPQNSSLIWIFDLTKEKKGQDPYKDGNK